MKSADARRFAVLVLMSTATAGCADVSNEAVSLCYSDAYAAPREQAELILHTRRSLSGHVAKVTVAGGELLPAGTILFNAEQAGFGEHLTTPTRMGLKRIMQNLFVGDPDHPQVKVPITIPGDTQLRGSTPMDLKIEFVRAKSSGLGEFETEAPEAILPASLTVVAPGWEWPMRLRDAAGRFIIAMVFVLLIGVVTDAKDRGLRVPTAVLICLGAAGAFVVFRFSTEPIAAVFGVVQSGWRALVFVGVLVAAAGFLDYASKLRRKFRPVATTPA